MVSGFGDEREVYVCHGGVRESTDDLNRKWNGKYRIGGTAATIDRGLQLRSGRSKRGCSRRACYTSQIRQQVAAPIDRHLPWCGSTASTLRQIVHG